MRLSAVACLTALLAGAAPPAPVQTPPPVPLSVKPALDAITPASLKGNLSFLSSDLLAGRYSPSPGLEIAAEFIASQFRTAGLSPAVNGSYFQSASMVDRTPRAIETDLLLISDGKRSTVPPSSLRVIRPSGALKLNECPVLVVAERNVGLLKGQEFRGKVIVAPNIDYSALPESEREGAYEKAQAFDSALQAGGARLELLSGSTKGRGSHRGARLVDPSKESGNVPVVLAESDVLREWIAERKGAGHNRQVSLDLPAPDDRPVTLKNVIGVLPGSDPKLKNTYVLLTAHYDHIGTAETGASMSPQKPGSGPDKIYNGANDDGSGTVSVIEIARGLAKLRLRPKRTLVFMTFFGEERGDIGSHYYADHPVFPLEQTVADLNLEQVGRTDASDGKQVNNASVTGFDYSGVTQFLQNAGRRIGINIYLNKEGSDAYFERSDNAALAEAGVPAHTLCVAFEYPDYHGLDDVWTKVDYDNMAKVDRAVALGLWTIANSTAAPRWNAANPKTAPFRAAQARLVSQAKTNPPRNN